MGKCIDKPETPINDDININDISNLYINLNLKKIHYF